MEKEITKLEKKNRFIIFIKNNNIKYILYCIFLIIFSLLMLQLSELEQTGVLINLFDNNFGKIASLITVISIIVYSIIFIKKLDICKLFLITIIPIGIVYAILSPIGRIPDENSHFNRAYEISYGHLITDISEEGIVGRDLPKELRVLKNSNATYKDLKESIETDYGEGNDFLEFNNTAIYTFICYLPQTLGIIVSRLFGADIFVQAYVSRIFNLITYITIIYFAIKLIPFKKLAVVLIAFLPISMQEAASLSPDCITNAVCIFFVAYIMYLSYLENKLNKKQIIILSIVSIFVALVKIIYLPLCALIYLIPSSKFDGKKKKFIILTTILLVCIILNLGWLNFARKRYVQVYNGANPTEQVKYIIHNPYKYFKTCVKVFASQIEYYITGLVGDSLSRLNVNTTPLFQIPLFILLIFTFLFDEEGKCKTNVIEKIYIFLIASAVVALLYTSEYISWTSVGADTIAGIQPRYFIPILLLVAICFNCKNIKFDEKIDNKYIFISLVAVNMNAICFMLNHYMK